MTTRCAFWCLLLFVLLGVPVKATSQRDGCPMKHIVPERLPDLRIPRCGHSIFYVNGELTVAGGRTTHFVPTPTAEYFSGGEWHPLPMAYTHDNGFSVVLPSGEVIIGGGHDEELGIGQTYTLERYIPQRHTFEGFGCLDRRRVLANATLLDDGRIIIAGNHYANDAIACYDGRSQVQHVKDVVQGRSNPYILPVESSDAFIIGGNDQFDQPIDTLWVDRVMGDAFRVPLLERWRPVYTDLPFSSDACTTDDYTYLLPVIYNDVAGHMPDSHSSSEPSPGQMGIVVVNNKGNELASEAPESCFSLLPTVCPIPMQSPYGPIFYIAPVVVDRSHQRGYLIGVDSLCRRQFVLAVDYAHRPATLVLYYTDPMEFATVAIPIVTPEGNLILAGGSPDDNYKPLTAVWCYHFGTDTPMCSGNARVQPADSSGWGKWLWVVLAVVVLAALAYIIINKRTKRATEKTVKTGALKRPNSEELLQRICQLMDEEQLYLRSDLKVQDVAVRLGTNSSYVSESINSGRGQSFSQFVKTYRVRHAQELLRQKPDVKTAIVATESGFSTEASFFRNFKTVTGMTPREWLTTLS